jgi:hypothetical protein
MLAPVSIALYIIFPVLILVLRRFRPQFAYMWLVCALANLVVFPLVLLTRSQLPQVIQLETWSPQGGLPFILSLQIDQVSWSFALALSALNLAVVLTDIARSNEGSWAAWTGSMALTGIGILSVYSGNPLVLLLTWQAIDFIELLILLGQGFTSEESQPVVVVYGARLVGSLIVTAAIIYAAAEGNNLSFDTLTPFLGGLLLAGAGLRLGALPFYPNLSSQLPFRHGLGSVLRMIPAASSLILVTRTAQVGASPNLGNILLLMVCLVAVFSSLSWMLAKDVLDGRRFWSLGIACLAFGAALRAQPEASLAWSITLILSGGLLFLTSTRVRWMLFLSIAGLVTMSALPYTPSWAGLNLYSAPFQLLLVLLLLSQAFLLAGYARHSLFILEPESEMERSSWVIYIWGLALIPLIHVIISIWNGSLLSGPTLSQNWPLLAIYLLTGLLAVLYYLGWRIKLPSQLVGVSSTIFSFQWLFYIISQVYHFLRRTTAFISLIMEGEGGILWSILLVLLLLSVLISTGAGQ